MLVQRPLSLRHVPKSDLRVQFAALCYRSVGKQTQVCLITSRRRRRWIIPKGWPMHNQTPAEAAAQEAWEEAGLTGKALDLCLGVYLEDKRTDDGILPVLTMVYPMHVTAAHTKWPEKDERRRKWYRPKKAAKKLDNAELGKIVKNFNAKQIQKGKWLA